MFFCLVVPSLGNAANSCVISPSYHKLALWIGPHTRASNFVLNTEYQKGRGSKQTNPADHAEMDISEDRLINEIINLKVRLAVIVWITACIVLVITDLLSNNMEL